MTMVELRCCVLRVAVLAAAVVFARLDGPNLRALGQDAPWPLLFADDFEHGAGHWEPTDPKAWRVVQIDGNHVLSQFRASRYRPPYRSPFNIALLKGILVSDFVLEARLKSTTGDYGHRDMCLFFGYQDAGHFYYVHLGKKADQHSNQIHIVDGSPRRKISTSTTPGTNWDDRWHRVRIVRRVSDGSIKVYFDDMRRPAMTARSKRFTWGRVGIGSFDDTGNWDDVKLWGVKAAGPKGP